MLLNFPKAVAVDTCPSLGADLDVSALLQRPGWQQLPVVVHRPLAAQSCKAEVGFGFLFALTDHCTDKKGRVNRRLIK